MRIFILSLIVGAVFSFSNHGFAATVIESTDGKGTTHKTWVQGKQIRVDVSNEPNYMLFDAESDKMYVVNTAEKQIIDMSSFFQGDSKKTAKDNDKPEFVSVGKGPEVAGYATEEYQFIVNGQKCSTEFLSLKALQKFESPDIFKAFSRITDSAGMDYVRGMMDPCDSARIDFAIPYSELGMPLRIIDRKGALESEIIRIIEKVSVPDDWFAVPTGYEIISPDQMMPYGTRDFPPGPGGGMMPPDLNNAMGKEIDPEKLQKMMQEMMQQMGQEK